ncbi:MAG: signal peptidase I [Glutamicibacter sp.]|uniref:signal peptidase I n=1 Tax=Glutamicibacter sp. BW80 TaxID=2024404 RepID=UPI00159699A6|nr:signal peptidase I [Glutamicibacter sp. BW80]
MTAQTRAELKKERETTGLLWWSGQVASWLALFVVLALIAVMIVIPKLGGATAYTVLTGSMRPEFPPGSLIVVRPADMEEIRIGDVVTYQLTSGEPEVVTHRVAAVSSTLSGETQFTLRGDANNTDDDPVRPEQIRGKLWYSMPLLGFINSAISGQQRTWLTWAAAGSLLVYSMIMFAGAWREKQRKERT